MLQSLLDETEFLSDFGIRSLSRFHLKHPYAHYGMGQVVVLDKEGRLIRRYSSGNLTTSNCAFSNSNSNYLFITGGIGTEDGLGGIFRLNLGVYQL